ncbi:hypothetical protein GCM10020255_105940 [Rhodococcus baikonurensis]
MTEYVLPELDYDYAALEPHISGEIMELHHSKHHATYVAGANSAIEQLAAAREDGTISTKAPLLSKNLAFHLGGHTNHSIFWKNLSPTAVSDQRASWQPRSTSTSVPSTHSSTTSPL